MYLSMKFEKVRDSLSFVGGISPLQPEHSIGSWLHPRMMSYTHPTPFICDGLNAFYALDIAMLHIGWFQHMM